MKLLVVGTGRMGTAVAEAARARGHVVRLLGRAENPGGAGLVPGVAAGCDAAIEFTRPEAAPGNLRRLAELGLPTVTGTTGWLDELPAIAPLVHRHGGALLHAANFSVGVHLFLRAARAVAATMRGRAGFDAAITEVHHVRKLDAPSGTALVLQEALRGADPDRAWPITSRREGDVVGEHTVRWLGPHDEITFAHAARDRTAFAEGAVAAAEWLPGHRGVFTFEDMLFGGTG